MPHYTALAVHLSAWCALRRGEVLGLTVADFIDLDSDKPLLLVARQVVEKRYGTDPQIGPTKRNKVTKKQIPTDLVPLIKAQIETYTDGTPKAFIFPSRKNSHAAVAGRTFEQQFNEARAAAKITKHVTPHSLRHTGLTFYGNQGATLAEIMERAGHSDIKAAMIYQHATQERDVQNTAKLNPLVAESLK